MARKTVTEDDLGLAPTDEEMETAVGEIETADIEHAEPAEAPEETKPAEPAPKAEEPKMVDVRALQEARAEAREARERAAVMEQRWNDFLASQNRPKEEKPAVPNTDDDPITAVKWTQDQIIAMREEAERRAREEQEARHAAETERELVAEAGAEFEAAAKADPTLRQAYDALVKSFQTEAVLYRIPPHQVQQHLARTELQHLAYARQNRIPLADYIKGMAHARGWQAAPAVAEQQAPAQKTDLAAVAAAQQRHQSLSDAPGGEAVAPVDAKALAKMTDKQFKAWIAQKGNEQKFDEIMGA